MIRAGKGLGSTTVGTKASTRRPEDVAWLVMRAHVLGTDAGEAPAALHRQFSTCRVHVELFRWCTSRPSERSTWTGGDRELLNDRCSDATMRDRASGRPAWDLWRWQIAKNESAPSFNISNETLSKASFIASFGDFSQLFMANRTELKGGDEPPRKTSCWRIWGEIMFDLGFDPRWHPR